MSKCICGHDRVFHKPGNLDCTACDCEVYIEEELKVFPEFDKGKHTRQGESVLNCPSCVSDCTYVMYWYKYGARHKCNSCNHEWSVDRKNEESKQIDFEIPKKLAEEFDERGHEFRVPEPDYTEIRDNRIRTKICELMSEMLDNPDEHGIYLTSRFMWKMESFVMKENAFWTDGIRSEAERVNIDCRGTIGMAVLHTMVDKIKELEQDFAYSERVLSTRTHDLKNEITRLKKEVGDK